MYKHSLWDEEEERHAADIYKKDKEAPDYHRQAEYNAHGAEQSDVYSSNKAKDESGKKEATGIEKEVEKETKKYESKTASEESIKIKAASDIHSASSLKDDKDAKDKKAHKSIEEAIEKAIKEEKEVIHIKD